MAIELEKIKPWDGQSGTGADNRGVIDRNFEKVKTELDAIDTKFSDVDDDLVQLAGEIQFKSLTFTVDIATTRKLIPLASRFTGLHLSYSDAGVRINEQYIGTQFHDIEWVKDSNWVKIASIADIDNHLDEVFSSRAVVDVRLKNAIKSISGHWKSTSNLKLDGTVRRVWLTRFGSASDGKTYFGVKCDNVDGTMQAELSTNILTSSIQDLTNVEFSLDSIDLKIDVVLDATLMPYTSALSVLTAEINPNLIKPTSAKSNFNISLTSGFNNFTKIGGELLSANFGVRDQSLRIPFLFNGKTAIKVRLKIDNIHREENVLRNILRIVSGKSSNTNLFVLALDSMFNRRSRVTNNNGNNSGAFGDSYPVSNIEFKNIVFTPGSQTFSNVGLFNKNVIPFTDGDGFSIRFIGDVNAIENRNLACELTADKFRIFDHVADSTIYEVLLSTLDGTVKSLVSNLKSNLPETSFEVKKISDGKIASLTQFSFAKFISNKNNGTSNFLTAFPVYCQYALEREFDFTIVIDSANNYLRFYYNDAIYEPINISTGFFTNINKLIGKEVDMFININSEIQGVTFTNISVSEDIEQYKIRRILACGHDIQHSDVELTTLPMTSSTTRLEDMFAELKRRGFVNVSANDYVYYLEGIKKLPAKTFCVVYDDNRYELYNDRNIRDVHLKYDQKPAVAAILNEASNQYPAGKFPTKELIQTMESIGWNTVIHGYNHYPLTRLSYEELISEINSSKDEMDKLLINSKIWILSGGNTDYEVTNQLMQSGFILCPTSSSMPNRSNVAIGGNPVVGRMHVEDYVTWQQFIDSLE